MKANLLLIACAAAVLSSCADYSLISPDGKLAMSLFQDETSKNVMFSLTYEGKSVLDSVTVGLTTDTQTWSDNLKIAGAKNAVVSDDYTMITGKKSHITTSANEETVTLRNENGAVLEVRFRLYNDGLAFQYIAPDAGTMILGEGTNYRIPVGVNRWIENYEPGGYEAFYPKKADGQKTSWKQREHSDWGYPALIEPSDSVFALITEANMRRGHCGSYMRNDDNEERYQVRLAEDSLSVSGTDGTAASANGSASGSYESPWRIIIAGDLSTIVESTLVTDVSDPSAIEDTDWIKPGPAAWIYWANNHGSNDYKIVTSYMDLAKEMGWPYNLIDAEWDGMANGGDIEDAFAYSNSIGVKSLLWYNSSVGWINGAPTPYYRLNKPEDRDKEFSWLNDLGCVGIKVDFFKNDDSFDMDYYIDLMEDAAKHHLMINFHGATIPRGWQRTYPNLMSMEAVYGAEWYNNLPILTNKAAAHNATLPFTRNVIGSMDYTPGTFSDSQHPHITTHAHELALTVLFESGIQHMPDSPETYRSLPEEVKAVLSTLPTAWDDTKLLAGYPGEQAVIARRKGDHWYIAGINGLDEPTTLSFSLARLSESAVADASTSGKTTEATTIAVEGQFFCDTTDEDRAFDISTRALDGETLSIPCRARGGFLIVL